MNEHSPYMGTDIEGLNLYKYEKSLLTIFSKNTTFIEELNKAVEKKDSEQISKVLNEMQNFNQKLAFVLNPAVSLLPDIDNTVS